MSSIWAPSGASKKHTRRPLLGGSCSRTRNAVLPQFCHRAGIIVGIEGDVLDAVMLLVILRRDQGRDVECQPVQVYPMSAARYLSYIGRAEIVDVKSHSLLRILC